MIMVHNKEVYMVRDCTRKQKQTKNEMSDHSLMSSVAISIVPGNVW